MPGFGYWVLGRSRLEMRRVHFLSALFHVVTQHNRRQVIIDAPEDFRRFQGFLDKLHSRSGGYPTVGGSSWDAFGRGCASAVNIDFRGVTNHQRGSEPVKLEDGCQALVVGFWDGSVLSRN